MLPAPTRGLTVRYVVVMFVVAALSGLAFLAMYYVSSRGARLSSFVRLCDEQRTSSVHIAYFATRLSQPAPAGEHEIDRKRLDQETTALLTDEKTVMAPGGPLDQAAIIDPDVKILYTGSITHLDKIINDYGGLARIIEAVPEGSLPVDDDGLAQLQDVNAHQLLDGLNTAVGTLRDAWQRQRMLLLCAEVAIFISTILALIFAGLFVFRPMIRMILTENHELIATERRLSAVINTVG